MMQKSKVAAREHRIMFPACCSCAENKLIAIFQCTINLHKLCAKLELVV